MAVNMEDVIDEVAHSLTVEHMTMTDEEKDNLRRVARGELTHRELIDKYVAKTKRVVTRQH